MILFLVMILPISNKKNPRINSCWKNHIVLFLFAGEKVNGGVPEVTAASSHMMMC